MKEYKVSKVGKRLLDQYRDQVDRGQRASAFEIAVASQNLGGPSDRRSFEGHHEAVYNRSFDRGKGERVIEDIRTERR